MLPAVQPYKLWPNINTIIFFRSEVSTVEVLLLLSLAIIGGIDRSLVATEMDVSAGKYRLLYAAPEAVVGDHTWTRMLVAPPLSSSLVAITVDEAHCVYKW